MDFKVTSDNNIVNIIKKRELDDMHGCTLRNHLNILQMDSVSGPNSGPPAHLDAAYFSPTGSSYERCLESRKQSEI
jgi:hypothetical protein